MSDESIEKVDGQIVETDENVQDHSVDISSCDLEMLKKVEMGLIKKFDSHNEEEIHSALKIFHALNHVHKPYYKRVENQVLLRFVVNCLLDVKDPKVIKVVLEVLDSIGKNHHEILNFYIRPELMEKLVILMETSDEFLLGDVIHIIGIISNSVSRSRSFFVERGIRRHVILLLAEGVSDANDRKSCYWILLNLIHDTNQLEEDLELLIPLLQQSLLEEKNIDVLSHICWVISSICQKKAFMPMVYYLKLLDDGIIHQITSFLGYTDIRIIRPCLRTVGNIVCMETDQEKCVDFTQKVIEYGVVPLLKTLMFSRQKDIQKEVCWTLSNIAAGTQEQIQVLLENDILQIVIGMLSNMKVDPEVRAESAYILFNVTTGGNEQQIESLMSVETMDTLITQLLYHSLIDSALDSIDNVLQIGERLSITLGTSNPYAELLSSRNRMILENTKYTKGPKKGEKIWDKYFITCKICEESYCRSTEDIHYCSECRCFVCKFCDCSKYHYDNVLNEILLTTSTNQSNNNNKKKKKKKTKSNNKNKKNSTKNEKNNEKKNNISATISSKEKEIKKEPDTINVNENQINQIDSSNQVFLDTSDNENSQTEDLESIESLLKQMYGNNSIYSKALDMFFMNQNMQNMDYLIKLDSSLLNLDHFHLDSENGSSESDEDNLVDIPDEAFFEFSPEEMFNSYSVSSPDLSPSNDHDSIGSRNSFLNTIRSFLPTDQDIEQCHNLVEYLESTGSILALSDKIDELYPD
ncbi:hypothetical protein WA158_008181 [Blastocystis sp. Blastoise]